MASVQLLFLLRRQGSIFLMRTAIMNSLQDLDGKVIPVTEVYDLFT